MTTEAPVYRFHVAMPPYGNGFKYASYQLLNPEGHAAAVCDICDDKVVEYLDARQAGSILLRQDFITQCKRHFSETQATSFANRSSVPVSTI